MTQVLLIPVQTAAQKLQKIVHLATQHLHRHEHLCYLVENDLSRDYIDKLLWSSPPESFLPHSGELISIALKPTKELTHYFNLSSHPLLDRLSGTIYEFDDQTSPIKADGCKMRYNAYKKAGYSIATL